MQNMKPDKCSSTKDSFEKLKEEGNVAFKDKEWEKARKCYAKALNASKSNAETLICLKNRAAVLLKLEKYEEAITDTSEVLESSPNDPKALYRRCQALEQLNRFEEAYRDARHILLVDPGNKDIQPILSRLHQKVQEYAKQNSEVKIKITQMYNYAFNLSEDSQKRETAISNILVLARESNGVKALFEADIIGKIRSIIKVEKNSEIRTTLFQILEEVLKNSIERTKSIITLVGIPWFFDLLNSEEEAEVQACQKCIQTLLNTLSGSDGKKDSTVSNEACAENKKEIDTILTCLIYTSNSRSITALARDAILSMITRNVHYRAINWAIQLVEIKGLQRLLEIASELAELKYESSMKITHTTRTLVAACLTLVYENMYYDKVKKDYLENISEFLKEKFLTPDVESKIRVTVAITTLLSGPIDVGNYVMGKEGVMEMILAMADSEDVLQQKIACECIVAAITKQDRAQFLVRSGIDVLRKLYESNDETIRIRALVGLCKTASAGGTDASIRLFADGASKKMAEACKKFLVGGKDKDTKRWAAEGFSFLSFDAEVKEMLIDDPVAIKALIDVAKSNIDTAAIYAIVNVFVNLCNAYEKKEILPEMIELAKFAKRHIPEEHEFDDEDFVIKRLNILGKLGLTSALVALSKVESENCKELICRIFNALCGQPDLRGLVVQQGGVKVLISMSLECTENGKRHAAQAVARIGITMNPEVAFPGERCVEIIRPLLSLLHPDCPALMNFEALMALCNLASIGEKTREHIFTEKGVSRIESYMYEDHVLLQRAATQCITNLAMSPLLLKQYEGDNDKLKFLFLLCGEEDTETTKAASGAIAILTANSEKCCSRIFAVKDWLDIFRQILAHPDKEVQIRAVAIVQNVIESKKENAEELLNSQVMEILMALSIIHEDGMEKVREGAGKCLRIAENMKVIKKPGESDEE